MSHVHFTDIVLTAAENSWLIKKEAGEHRYHRRFARGAPPPSAKPYHKLPHPEFHSREHWKWIDLRFSNPSFRWLLNLANTLGGRPAPLRISDIFTRGATRPSGFILSGAR